MCLHVHVVKVLKTNFNRICPTASLLNFVTLFKRYIVFFVTTEFLAILKPSKSSACQQKFAWNYYPTTGLGLMSLLAYTISVASFTFPKIHSVTASPLPPPSSKSLVRRGTCVHENVAVFPANFPENHNKLSVPHYRRGDE